ncbi:acyl carrier protein [Lentzea sp. NPDC054927]
MTFTVEDLRRILRESAGHAPAGEFADVEFTELGYESLALLETGGRIEREYHVALDDNAVASVRTPRELVALVTLSLREAS